MIDMEHVDELFDIFAGRLTDMIATFAEIKYYTESHGTVLVSPAAYQRLAELACYMILDDIHSFEAVLDNTLNLALAHWSEEIQSA